jgi:hypothetical protein
MKPLNLDNRPCSPISSNCVIWQGPDIPCIKLCTGDTVSDVVFKLATELCAIMDTLKITNYDLSCFNLIACPPDDFQKLIQLIIDRICALENINNSEATGSGNPRGLRSTSTCPDCVVTVAEPFVVGTQTTMQLVDYVLMIGQKITSIIDEIINLQIQITDLLVRVTAIENTPPPITPTPTIIVGCNIGTLISGNSYAIDTVLDQLINSVASGYCSLLGVLGTPAQIGSSLVPACAFGTDVTTDPNWTPVPSTLAESITNAWIVICDVYAAVSTGLVSTTNTNSVNLDLTAGVLTANIQDTGWVDLDGFAWYGTYNIANKKVPQCRRIGNAVHFRGVVMIPLQDPLNGTQPLIWDYNGSAPLTDTYFLNTTVAPSQVGPGSVVLNSGGSITFNQGLSVIPTSIVDAGTNFDNSYFLNYTIAYRFINISSVPLYSGMLTTLVKPIITSNKTLILTLVKDSEESAGTGGTVGNPYSTSIANNVISHVRSGEYVPKYQSASSVMNSSPLSGAQPVTLDYDATLTYPFSCDANNETNVGGFGWIQLDGLIAYLDPCTTDIKNYSCP